MNILHIIDSLAVGGAERVLVELANQAARDGHRVAVCVTRSETTLAAGPASGDRSLGAGTGNGALTSRP